MVPHHPEGKQQCFSFRNDAREGLNLPCAEGSWRKVKRRQVTGGGEEFGAGRGERQGAAKLQSAGSEPLPKILVMLYVQLQKKKLWVIY